MSKSKLIRCEDDGVSYFEDGYLYRPGRPGYSSFKAAKAWKSKEPRRKIEMPALGSYSHGSHRTEDILSGIESLLPGRMVKGIQNALRRGDEEDASMRLNEDAWDYINSRCPAYTYFGAHEGDGSDFGVWVSMESLEEDARYDDGVIKVADTADIPKGYVGYVMHVNDHGNVTLYNKTPRKLTEIWGVV